MNNNHPTGLPQLLVAFIAAGGILASASEAGAHGKMDKTVPADGAMVAPGLAEIGFVFTDAIRMTLVKVTQQESEAAVASTFELPKKFDTKAKIALEPLAPGIYAVTWTGVGRDGHVMKGSFSFSVASPKSSQSDKDAH